MTLAFLPIAGWIIVTAIAAAAAAMTAKGAVDDARAAKPKEPTK